MTAADSGQPPTATAVVSVQVKAPLATTFALFVHESIAGGDEVRSSGTGAARMLASTSKRACRAASTSTPR